MLISFVVVSGEIVTTVVLTFSVVEGGPEVVGALVVVTRVVVASVVVGASGKTDNYNRSIQTFR